MPSCFTCSFIAHFPAMEPLTHTLGFITATSPPPQNLPWSDYHPPKSFFFVCITSSVGCRETLSHVIIHRSKLLSSQVSAIPLRLKVPHCTVHIWPAGEGRESEHGGLCKTLRARHGKDIHHFYVNSAT